MSISWFHLQIGRDEHVVGPHHHIQINRRDPERERPVITESDRGIRGCGGNHGQRAILRSWLVSSQAGGRENLTRAAAPAPQPCCIPSGTPAAHPVEWPSSVPHPLRPHSQALRPASHRSGVHADSAGPAAEPVASWVRPCAQTARASHPGRTGGRLTPAVANGAIDGRVEQRMDGVSQQPRVQSATVTAAAADATASGGRTGTFQDFAKSTTPDGETSSAKRDQRPKLQIKIPGVATTCNHRD